MKRYGLILIGVLFIATSSMALPPQRAQIIALLLHRPAFDHHLFDKKPNQSEVFYNTNPSKLLRADNAAIPTYSLPRGAIICRMEDAIQKHTKIKVNVGVGGE